MQYSEVLIKILNRAKEVQKHTQVQYLSAPAILVAIAELCGTKYHGITNYYSEHHPVWYEEERLRYLYEKMFRASGNLVSAFVKKRLSKDYSEYDVDFLESYKAQLEVMMTERDIRVLTSDIVFLLALDSIKNRTRMGLLPQYQDGIPLRELLIEVDGCIYDYVISEIGKIQEQLQKKVDEAKAKRDWKPASKFAEPEELLASFLSAVQVKKTERSLELVFPYFYDGMKELKLRIVYIEGIYYVTDRQGVTGCFCQLFDFMKYLQRLILLEKSPLTGYIPEISEIDVDWLKAEKFDFEKLLQELKQSVRVRYEEKEGLVLSIVHCCYANHNVSVSFLLETLEDGKVRISDNRKGFEKDENLEGFCLTEKIKDGFYIPLFFKFFNLAVVITELEMPMERLGFV